MSLAFNDTSAYRGIVQTYEQEIGCAIGEVSGDTTKLKLLTAGVNLAFDEFLQLAIPASGTHQYDDSNHTDHPIIRMNIVSGQRDYALVSDELANLTLDIHRVRIADSGGNYRDISPVDLQSEKKFDYFDSATGVATEYDKTGTTIILGATPNYNYTLGLEAYINREPSYFVYTDTTKKPGVPGLFHRWFAIRPAEDYARRNSLDNYSAIRAERLSMEKAIQDYFGARNRDERKRITPANHSNK